MRKNALYFTLFLMYLTLPLTATAQVVDIPDPNLRAEIERKLGKAPGDAITELDMLGLGGWSNSLNLSRDNISNLTGLEFATNLEVLDLDNNSISDISALAGLTKLERLDLNNNSISDISALAGLTELDWLSLSNNSISDISALAGLTSLSELYLSNNSISDISALAGLTSLSELYLSNNNISDISALVGLTSLSKLYLYNNSISDISALAGLTSLSELALSSNSISDISALAGLTSLSELYLYNNSISDISALAGLWRLSELHLSYNSISDISALAGLTRLDELDLSNNMISDLSPLIVNTGLSSEEISYVSVAGNPLSETSINTYLPTLRGRGIWGLRRSRLFSPTIAPVAVGQSFSLNLTVNDVYDLAGWQLNLAFNPAVLKAISVGEGDFLSKDGRSAFFAAGQIDNAAGSIAGLSGAVIGEGGATGGGTLLSIAFEAKAAGEGWLRMSEDKMSASNENRIHYDVVTPSVSVMVIVEPTYDLNGDGKVNILDLTLVAQNLGKDNPKADANRDGVVDVFDLVGVAQRLDNVLQAPGAGTKHLLAVGNNDRYSRQVHPRIDSLTVQGWISMAQAADDGSLAFKRGIANLKHLLAAIVPDETTLLANYPNPFNPETWIPYHLGSDAKVQLTIYDAKGALVRRLALGHQGAGYYTDQSRAAYWDGRNQRGDSVASGVYFYQLWTEHFSAVRKMVIVK